MAWFPIANNPIPKFSHDKRMNVFLNETSFLFKKLQIYDLFQMSFGVSSNCIPLLFQD